MSTQSTQNARVCANIPVIIVSDDSTIESNGYTTDLISGTVLKAVRLPIFCDVSISNSGCKVSTEKSDINPHLRVIYASVLYVPLTELKDGLTHECIIIETENGRKIRSDLININIGYGHKSNSENKEFSQRLYDECQSIKSMQSTDITNSDIIAAFATIQSNIKKIESDPELNIWIETLQTCMKKHCKYVYEHSEASNN